MMKQDGFYNDDTLNINNQSNIISNKIEEYKKSHMTKEQLLQIINDIDFMYLDRLELNIITGLKIDTNNEEVREIMYNINIY